ncbi:hypothetical protein CHISP_2709 [Chitinispirillum alkaliphilum]|nr:hypothetical protein CHISP_2709 [Chitinispirillum alkaliphilum]
MIDKERTIQKAKSKHKEIRPILGKANFRECFFFLHGEFFFLFRTKDNKTHTMRALEVKKSLQMPSIQWAIIVAPVKRMVTRPVSNSPILKLMNQPVRMRPIINVMTRPIKVSDLFKNHQFSNR